MACQPQQNAARALLALVAAMASLINSAAQYLKYFKIETKNYQYELSSKDVKIEARYKPFITS